MAGRLRTRRPKRSRLLGFGPWGYTLVGVFLAILLWGLLSPNPQHQFLVLVDRLFGIKATYWVVIWMMNTEWMVLQYPLYNLAYACVLAVAVFISSRRITLFGYAAIFGASVLAARLWSPIAGHFRNYPEPIIQSLNPLDHTAAASSLILNIAIGLALGLLTRSVIVAIATMSIALVAIFDYHLIPGYILTLNGTNWSLWLETDQFVGHLCYGGVLLFWAIKTRRRILPYENGCLSCGYDLTNLKSEQCPECGTQIEDSPAGDAS